MNASVWTDTCCSYIQNNLEYYYAVKIITVTLIHYDIMHPLLYYCIKKYLNVSFSEGVGSRYFLNRYSIMIQYTKSGYVIRPAHNNNSNLDLNGRAQLCYM